MMTKVASNIIRRYQMNMLYKLADDSKLPSRFSNMKSDVMRSNTRARLSTMIDKWRQEENRKIARKTLMRDTVNPDDAEVRKILDKQLGHPGFAQPYGK